MDPQQTTRYRRAFWAAVILTAAAWLLPFGGMAIYPFSLLATWAHEMGHGMAALLVGGGFHKLEVFPGLSGMAFTSVPAGGLHQAVMAAGGLVGAPLLGAAIIAVGPRPSWARGILFGLAAALLLSVGIWVRNPFGMGSLLALAAGVAAAAWKLAPRYRFVAVQLVGIQLALSALRGWRYLFVAEATVGGRTIPSDVSSIAHALGGPHWLWGALLLGLNLALLYGAYRLVTRRLRREGGG